MRFATACAVALLGLGLAARGEEDQAQPVQTKSSEESTSKTVKQSEHGKKKATKRQQLSRGGGPVGDEGARTSKTVRSSETATSSDLEPGAQTTTQKVTKRTQLKHGAGPEGTEGATSGQSNETKPATPEPSPLKGDHPRQ